MINYSWPCVFCINIFFFRVTLRLTSASLPSPWYHSPEQSSSIGLNNMEINKKYVNKKEKNGDVCAHLVGSLLSGSMLLYGRAAFSIHSIFYFGYFLFRFFQFPYRENWCPGDIAMMALYDHCKWTSTVYMVFWPVPLRSTFINWNHVLCRSVSPLRSPCNWILRKCFIGSRFLSYICSKTTSQQGDKWCFSLWLKKISFWVSVFNLI